MPEFLSENKLTKWFLDGYNNWAHSRFPGGGKVNYANVFRNAHDYLNTKVHPQVETRAALVDGNFLTDHGPSHIQMIMRRSQHLLPIQQWSEQGSDSGSGCLDPYEVFLLLMAIHFHDVGNMYGREGHEKQITKVMKEIPAMQELDRFECGAIANIAMCHGGKIHGSKDTITRLAATLHFGDIRFRPRLIAALLRLGDELAEDSSRASQFGMLSPERLPTECFIFHKYAAALNSVKIDQQNQEIALGFKLTQEDGCELFVHQGRSLYLLDYIHQRTLKAYQEMVYCARFTRDLGCRFEQISVSIDAYCEATDFQPFRTISYRLGEIGYPGNEYSSLEMLAPSLASEPNGQELAQLFTTECRRC